MRKNTKVKATVNTVNGNVVVVNNEAILARSIMSNTYRICNKRIGSILVDLLSLDYLYQRPVSAKEIEALITEWDDDRCDFLLVSYRDDKFYIIDGQHRYTAAKFKGIKELPCIILTGLTREKEALIFSQQNRNVKKLSVIDTFKANIACGDTSIQEVRIDMEINRICSAHSIKVAHASRYTKDEKILRSLSRARRIVKGNGADCFEWIIETICDSDWNTCSISYTEEIIGTLKNFYVENKENLPSFKTRIRNVMNSITPMQLIAKAKLEHAEYSVQTGLNICFKELVDGVEQ